MKNFKLISLIAFLSIFYLSSYSQKTEGYILVIEGDVIYLDFTDADVKLNDVVKVKKSGGFFVHPVTKDTIKRVDKVICKIKITEVEDSYSSGTVDPSSSIKLLEKGMKVYAPKKEKEKVVAVVAPVTTKTVVEDAVSSTSANREYKVETDNSETTEMSSIADNNISDEGNSGVSDVSKNNSNLTPITKPQTETTTKKTPDVIIIGEKVIPEAERKNVMILPFKTEYGLDATSNTISYSSQIFSNKLEYSKSINTHDLKKLELSEDDIRRSNYPGENITTRNAKYIGVDYFVLCTVNKPAVKEIEGGVPVKGFLSIVEAVSGQDLGSQYVSNIKTKKLVSTVHIKLDIIDVKTGKVVFTFTETAKATGKSEIKLEKGLLGGLNFNEGASKFKSTVTGEATDFVLGRLAKGVENYFKGNLSGSYHRGALIDIKKFKRLENSAVYKNMKFSKIMISFGDTTATVVGNAKLIRKANKTKRVDVYIPKSGTTVKVGYINVDYASGITLGGHFVTEYPNLLYVKNNAILTVSKNQSGSKTKSKNNKYVSIDNKSTVGSKLNFVKFGTTFANMQEEDDYEYYDQYYKMKTGLHFGMMFNIPMSNNFSFETGGVITNKGFKVSEDGYSGKLSLWYLEVPGNFRLGKEFFVYAGPYLAMGISGKFDYDGDTEKVKWGKDPDTDNLNRYDLGFSVGAGLDFESVRIEAAWVKGLRNIGTYSDDGYKVRNKVFTLSFCVKF